MGFNLSLDLVSTHCYFVSQSQALSTGFSVNSKFRRVRDIISGLWIPGAS